MGDDTVTDADKRDYDMTMDVREMMRRSSNVGFVLVGRKIGADDFAAYVDKWGIGHSSGVDFPGESLGIVKKRDQYDGATLGSMSFGQALSVSPIEIARAVGGIANGGVMMTPHFYKSSKGDEKDWGEGERAISEDAASQVTSCMQTVVSEGTGVGGAVDGYDVAGELHVVLYGLCTGTIAQGAVLHHARRNAERLGCRCGAVPVHYGQRARRAGYPAHEVGGYNLWGVVCCPI